MPRWPHKGAGLNLWNCCFVKDVCFFCFGWDFLVGNYWMLFFECWVCWLVEYDVFCIVLLIFLVWVCLFRCWFLNAGKTNGHAFWHIWLRHSIHTPLELAANSTLHAKINALQEVSFLNIDIYFQIHTPTPDKQTRPVGYYNSSILPHGYECRYLILGLRTIVETLQFFPDF